ncbi:ATP-binding cassette domain-containing protein [Streptomyces sp. P1-3]|uniref:ATP-binding cassette domain-containing protein n=1 Tax=Streptomyces sp. P1-3 TaxID=3421658 RepID=UPI003D36ABA0
MAGVPAPGEGPARRTRNRDDPGRGARRDRGQGRHLHLPGADRPAVDGISLTLRQGELIALVGENGSGKTTLSTLRTGLRVASTGTVAWDGTDPTSPRPIRTACGPASGWCRRTTPAGPWTCAPTSTSASPAPPPTPCFRTPGGQPARTVSS